MIDTKLLRQKILDLAIRGKLVPQNPADEPASELLKKIKAEKEALVKTGKIKKDKHESFIFRGDDKRYYEQIDGKTSDITEEIPFDIPETWEWCRIGNIMFLQAGKYIAASEIRKNETSTYRYPCYGGNGQRGFVKLFNSCGEYPLVGRQGALCGNINFAAGKFYATEHAVIVKVFSGCFPQWAAIFLKALNLNQYSTATAQPGLSVNVINTLLIPLPPVAEQQRIVSQIEALLAEVDKIDKDSADLESALSLAKQKVLDLAIRGKLVPQNPADEPASELLKKINAEKETLVKAGKIKKVKHESFIFRGDDNCYYEQLEGKTVNITPEIPFEIPESWLWCRLGTIADIERGSNFTKKDFVKSGVPCIHYGQIHTKFHYSTKSAISFIPEVIARKCRKVKYGDVVMAVTSENFNDVCKCVAWLNTEEAAVGGHTAIIRHRINPLYLVYFFFTVIFSNQKEKYYHDGKVVEFPPAALQKILLPIPPLSEQQRIIEKITQYDFIHEAISK